MRAAREGKLDGLATLVDGEVTRGELGRAEAKKLAEAVGNAEIRRATGDNGVTLVSELGACARALDDAFEERSEKEDEVAAQALLIRLRAGLALASAADKWIGAIPDGPRASFRKAAARAAFHPDDGERRRSLFLDPYEAVRIAALEASAVAADAADTEPVLEAARLDPSSAARAQAIRTAGALGGERVTLALKDLWPQADEALREAIVAAWANPSSAVTGGRRELLWVIETQTGSPALSAAIALLQSGTEGASAALGIVERAIAAGPLKDRLQAIAAASLTTKELREALVKIEDDPDEVVKLAALAKRVETPVDRGGAKDDERKKLGAKLLALASSETKRVALGAKLSLARAGMREVLPLIEKDLKSSDAQTRRAAGLALVALGELPRAARLVADADAHVRTGLVCALLTSDR